MGAGDSSWGLASRGLDSGVLGLGIQTFATRGCVSRVDECHEVLLAGRVSFVEYVSFFALMAEKP